VTWRQLRVQLSDDGLKPFDDGYQTSIRAKGSLWLYNRRSGEYDKPLKFGGSEAYIHYVFVFDEDDDGETLRMSSPSGSSGGGVATKWGYRDFGQVHIGSEPERATTKDTMTLKITGIASFFPVSEYSATIGGPYDSQSFGARAGVEQTWKIKILPGKKISFTVADPEE